MSNWTFSDSNCSFFEHPAGDESDSGRRSVGMKNDRRSFRKR